MLPSCHFFQASEVAERPIVTVAVEGLVDEAVAQVLIHNAGGEPGVVYGKQGKPHLKEKVTGYNNAAQLSPWLVLVDLDNDSDCAPTLREGWLTNPAPNLCFRIAVREVETWLLGDAETLSRYLSVARSRFPLNPERLPEPKSALVNLARRSRRREIREGLVPRDGSGRDVGPTYTSQLVQYTRSSWRPRVAAKHSESLDRAIRCLERIVGR